MIGIPERIQEGAGVTFVYRRDSIDGHLESTLTEAEVIAVAEWARREALNEAETVVRPTYRFEGVNGTAEDPIMRANWALHHAADRIRALVEGEPK